MRLHGAMLYVKDLPRMQAFYRDLLGIDPHVADDTWVEFDTAGGMFALHAIPADRAGAIEVTSPPRPREGSAVKLLFGVRDVEAERARLEARGVQLVRRPWGDWDVIDPEGNIAGIRPFVPREPPPDATLL